PRACGSRRNRRANQRRGRPDRRRDRRTTRMTEPRVPPPAEPERPQMAAPRQSLLARVEVVNVGVGDFATAIWSQGVQCVQVDWEPPGPEDPEMKSLLDRLL